jgi:hypothetical protein
MTARLPATRTANISHARHIHGQPAAWGCLALLSPLLRGPDGQNILSNASDMPYSTSFARAGYGLRRLSVHRLIARRGTTVRLEQRLDLQRRRGEPEVNPAWASTATRPLRQLGSPTYTGSSQPGGHPPRLSLPTASALRLLLLHRRSPTPRCGLWVWTAPCDCFACGLLMATLEKRSLGSWGQWLCVMIFAKPGILVVPRAKLLRAREAISVRVVVEIVPDTFPTDAGHQR